MERVGGGNFYSPARSGLMGGLIGKTLLIGSMVALRFSWPADIAVSKRAAKTMDG